MNIDGKPQKIRLKSFQSKDDQSSFLGEKSKILSNQFNELTMLERFKFSLQDKIKE